MKLHADRRRLALVPAHDLPWLPSPTSGVERRLLERQGGEVALATSLVRYAPGSAFPGHGHELGEEFLVLDGVFSDEHGDHPAGTYVRNPPGTRHAPFSRSGCLIFVKLRQMDANDRSAVCVRPEDHRWQPTTTPGVDRAPLWSSAGQSVHLERLQAGAYRPGATCPGGEEWLVVQGGLQLLDAQGRANLACPALTWRRDATPRQPDAWSPDGCLLWVKRGHLPDPLNRPVAASPLQNDACPPSMP